jgi:hypothetical protein
MEWEIFRSGKRSSSKHHGWERHCVSYDSQYFREPETAPKGLVVRNAFGFDYRAGELRRRYRHQYWKR